MAVNPLVQNQHMAVGFAGIPHGSTYPHLTHTIPVLPSAPSLDQHPFAPASHAHPMAQQYYPPAGPLGPLAFSSFMSNEPASGAPPLSAHGHVQASLASLAPEAGPSQQASAAPGSAASGASTVSAQPPYQDALGE